MRQAALGALGALGGYEEVAVEERVLGPEEAQGPGGGVVLWALARGSILGSDALARRGIPAEEVGEAAARALVLEMESGATLDVRTADQLIPYMALARRPSTFLVRALEGHLRTQMDLLKEFLGCRIEVEEVGRLFRVGVHPSPTAP
jgi:RNA 3'-terminal phosphate cyclase